jgi:hypothetical protein
MQCQKEALAAALKTLSFRGWKAQRDNLSMCRKLIVQLKTWWNKLKNLITQEACGYIVI